MSLNSLFYPKSVALLGASTDEGSVGNEIAKNLTTNGYKGKLSFVNPKGGRIFGKKLLKSTAGIGKNLDLAIIAIPAKFVLEEIKNLAVIKTKSVVVISAGFREVGHQDAERELKNVCTENNISLIGPNCLGFINPKIKLNASFAPLMPKPGSVAFISQSGALLASVLDYAARENIGFSKVVSTGNKAQVGESELLEYLKHDPETNVIALYMEELENPEKIRQLAKEIIKKAGKPIIAIKAGKTEVGKKAALSHTGSLGGSDEAYESLFRQSGIIRADNIEEMFDIIELFQRNKTRQVRNIAIITNAGGPGVMTADAMAQKGLKLSQISQATRKKLQKFLPSAASIKNPIDILGDADATRYEQTIKIILGDSGVDAVEIILTPQSTTQVDETARAIVKLKKLSQKPIIATFMGQDLVESGIEILNKNEVTTTLFPENSASSFAALKFLSFWKKSPHVTSRAFTDVNKDKVSQILNNSFPDKSIPMENAFEILNAYGFPTTPRWQIENFEQAKHLAKKIISHAVVLRIISNDISHKSDVGGVVMNVKPSNIPTEYSKLMSKIKRTAPKAKIDGVDISEQVGGEGLEIILGVKTDPMLGKQVAVGLGGIYTEVFKDVSWGLAPLTTSDVERMIASLKIKKIISGYRNQPPLDIKKISECTLRLSQLVTDFPSIGQIDINPLFVHTKGAVALDVRLLML